MSSLEEVLWEDRVNIAWITVYNNSDYIDFLNIRKLDLIAMTFIQDSRVL